MQRVVVLHYSGVGGRRIRLRNSFSCVWITLLKRFALAFTSAMEAAVSVQNPALSMGLSGTSVRVWRTTVNWLDANRIGMTFSFLFGPAALTFLAMVPRRRTNSKYLNTMIGAVAGAPMAVCTNCVAPIARGFYAAGMSRESVLAAMFASPALNVVVLAMTFALFPAKVALLKLATVLFLIFVFAPAA